MWFIWVFIGIIFCLLLAALFLPFEIEIDSNKNYLSFRLIPVFKISSKLISDDFLIKLNLLGYKRQWSLWRLIIEHQKNIKEKSKETKNRKSNGSRLPFRTIVKWTGAFLETLDPIVWRINIDPGPHIFGIAYPLQLIKWKGKPLIRFNLEQKNQLQCKVRNQLARVLWAGLVH